MTLTRSLRFAGITVTSLAALLVGQGCSSSSGTPETVVDSGTHDSGKTPDGGKTDAKTDAKPDAAKTPDASKPDTGPVNDKTDAGRPPQPVPDAGKTMATTPHNLAIRNLYLGDQDPGTFTTDGTAWKNFGYNIDGLITTATSTDVCTLDVADQASTQIQQDGTNGIDNSFGANIASILSALTSSSSISMMDIQAGKFTLMFDTVGLDGTATQNASGLTGQLFAGSTYDGTPAITGSGSTASFAITDDWPVNGSLLVDPTMISSGSTIKFASAYVNGGTWVSGQPVDIQLNLSISGETLALTIHSGVVTMPTTVDSMGQFHSTTGLVSGVIATNELLSAIGTIGAKLGYCQVIGSFLPAIRSAQDIILTGNTVSNTKGTACNAISIGLAFDADEIAQPTMIAPTVDAGAPVAPCPDAGM